MATSALRIDVRPEKGVQVVRLVGSVDSATLPQFQDILERLFSDASVRVLIDCTGMDYINSKGLALLASYHRRCLSSLARLALCGVSRKMTLSMNVLGLTQMLKFFDGIDDALLALR
jgi:anti-anti-sigma factor